MGRLGTARPKFYVCWLCCNLGVTIYWSSLQKWRVKLFAVPGYKRKDPARTSLWRTSFTNFANLLPWRSYIQQVPDRMKWRTLDSPNAGCQGYIIFLVKWIQESFSISRDFFIWPEFGLPQWLSAVFGQRWDIASRRETNACWPLLSAAVASRTVGALPQSHFRKVARIIGILA